MLEDRRLAVLRAIVEDYVSTHEPVGSKALVRLLAQLTRQVALVQYPSLVQSHVRHLDLVALSSTRVMVILVADSGRLEQRIVELPTPVADDAIATLRTRLLAVVVGRRCSELAPLVADAVESLDPGLRPAASVVASALLEVSMDAHEDRVVTGGTSNLTRYGDSFSVSVQPILEALEEQVVLLRLFGDVARDGNVVVRIGHENPVHDLQQTSFIASGQVAVLGPTRMDYPGAMATVQAVSQYLTRILGQQ